MAITIISPKNSFIQFSESDTVSDCGRNSFTPCLPVVLDSDVNFQFIAQTDTPEEADALCDLSDDFLDVGIVEACGSENLLTFSGTAERIKISPTQILYNWAHGLPDFATVIGVGDCFHITVEVNGGGQFCSNCLQRIEDTCLTSVVDYGGDDNQFGFDYCGGQTVDDTATGAECEPTIITFTNVGTLAIPYTAQLQAKYGDVPTVSTWIYDDSGDLVQMGIREAFDAFPPSVINLNFGGVSSGIVKIS